MSAELSLISTSQLAALVAGSVEYGSGYLHPGTRWTVPGSVYAPATGRWIDGDVAVVLGALERTSEVFSEYHSENFSERVAYRRHPVIRDAWVKEVVWEEDRLAERWAAEREALEAYWAAQEVAANRRFDMYEHVHGRAHRTLVYS